MTDLLKLYVLDDGRRPLDRFDDILPAAIEIINRREYVDDSGSVISRSLQFWYESVDFDLYHYVSGMNSSTPDVPESAFWFSISVDPVYLRDHTIQAANTESGEPVEIQPSETLETIFDLLRHVVDETSPERVVGDMGHVFSEHPVEDFTTVNYWHWLNVLSVGLFDEKVPTFDGDLVWKHERIDEYLWIVLSEEPTKTGMNSEIANHLPRFP